MGAPPCVRARAQLQEPSFADKLAALERWCNEHRPQEKLTQRTRMVTDWDEQWQVGVWLTNYRLKPHRVPEKLRAAFEAAVKRSGYAQVHATQAAHCPWAHGDKRWQRIPCRACVPVLMGASPCVRARALL